MVRNTRRSRVVLRLVRIDVVIPISFTDFFEAMPVSIRSGKRIVRGSRWAGARSRSAGDPLVGATFAPHGRRVRVVVGFLLVEGEGFFEVADANVEGRVHPVNPGVDREVVVAHRPDEEGAVERDRPGVVRLVPERARRRCRNRARRVFAVVGVPVVPGHVVVPGDASGDV